MALVEQDFARLLDAHRQLDFDCRNRDGRLFVGDWYAQHPFTHNVIDPQAAADLADTDLANYYFQNDFSEVHAEIVKFHERRDGQTYDTEEIFVGAGMSTLLTAQMMMLKRRGVTRLFCTRPVYKNYYYLADMLGIELVAINQDPLNEDAEFQLPTGQNEWLLICDPIWFMGRPVMAKHIEAIAQWQQENDGWVIVDGAFQYTHWDASADTEATAQLDRNRTMRAICPTKAVALHGTRFAYCLLPESLRDEMRYAYSNTAGSGCVFDRVAALSIMRYLNRPESNHEILDLIRSRHDMLTTAGYIEDDIGAVMTYFCFVKTKLRDDQLISMDQDLFNTTGYPGRTRFNLLSRHDTLERFVSLSDQAIYLT